MPDQLEASIRKAAEKQDLSSIEQKLGIPTGFYKSLLNEPNDWAFLIKLTVIIEAALNLVLSHKLGMPNNGKHIKNLPMQGRSGKVELAKELGIVDEIGERRVKCIISLRNQFAHSLNKLTTTLEEHVMNMEEIDISRIIYSLLGHPDKIQKSKGSEGKWHDPNKEQKSENFARIIVWTAGCIALQQLTQAHKAHYQDLALAEAHRLVGLYFVENRRGDKTAACNYKNQALAAIKSFTT